MRELSRQRRWKNSRKEGNDYFNLVFTYVIFDMRDVAISLKCNFEKLKKRRKRKENVGSDVQYY